MKEKNNEIKKSIYWASVIWIINNDKKNEKDIYINEIKKLLETNDKSILYFFISLSNKTCLDIINLLLTYIDKVIEKDLTYFWEEKDLHIYKYLIISIANYGYKHKSKYK